MPSQKPQQRNRNMTNQTQQTKPTETRTAPTDFDRLISKTVKEMSYVPFGAADPIRMTAETVQNLLCVKTKSGKTCTLNDAIKVMMLCHAQRLNPFAAD